MACAGGEEDGDGGGPAGVAVLARGDGSVGLRPTWAGGRRRRAEGQEERWEMASGGRWRPREDAKDGNGDAAWVVASSRRRTPPKSGSAALLEVGGRRKFW